MHDLTDYSIGRLLFHVCRLRGTHAAQLMEQFGLFRGQARVLLILSHDNGIMHSHIAEKLAISPAATTKVIKRLETLEYLERRPDPDDERVSRVYLLPKGRELIDKIHQAFTQLDEVSFRGIPSEDLETFGRCLFQIQSNLWVCKEEQPL
jgi:DNA-binding MarR family transcriptional regulator